MSEFDFEELDKAVKGALQPTASAPIEPAAPSVSTPAPTVTATPADTPAARRASTGRFMDLVHPSSDMRSSITVPPRQLAPSSSTLEPEVSAASAQATPAPVPLESPFLPDAKVEKRPLGGAPSVSSFVETPSPSTAAESISETPTENTFPDPMDFPSNHSELEQSSGETQGELDRIETETELSGDSDASSPDTAEANEAQSSPLESKQPTFTAPLPDEPLATPSIPQQYQEQEAAPAQPGAIYDTEAYHQPLAATPKKRSGLWIILWILLLVALGAGIGIAIYFYVIPLL